MLSKFWSVSSVIVDKCCCDTKLGERLSLQLIGAAKAQSVTPQHCAMRGWATPRCRCVW